MALWLPQHITDCFHQGYHRPRQVGLPVHSCQDSAGQVVCRQALATAHRIHTALSALDNDQLLPQDLQRILGDSCAEQPQQRATDFRFDVKLAAQLSKACYDGAITLIHKHIARNDRF